jgi:hypothetical protein
MWDPQSYRPPQPLTRIALLYQKQNKTSHTQKKKQRSYTWRTRHPVQVTYLISLHELLPVLLEEAPRQFSTLFGHGYRHNDKDRILRSNLILQYSVIHRSEHMSVWHLCFNNTIFWSTHCSRHLPLKHMCNTHIHLYTYIHTHTYCMCMYTYIHTHTVYSRLSAVMVGRNGAENQNQQINRSTHTQAIYTGIKLTSLIFYAINWGLTPDRFMSPCWARFFTILYLFKKG